MYNYKICISSKICRSSFWPSWSWSYCSWIYNYICNQCLSPGWCVQNYVIKLDSDLRGVGGFLRVLRFPPPIKIDRHDLLCLVNGLNVMYIKRMDKKLFTLPVDRQYWCNVYKENEQQNKMNCELMLTYDTPALRQTGSRNLTDPKTLPTIWGTYMKLVTKYQISAINSCWGKCD